MSNTTRHCGWGACAHRCVAEREALIDIPNVYGYQSFVETDKAGYIIRQWVASNLYDRIRYVIKTMYFMQYHSRYSNA